MSSSLVSAIFYAALSLPAPYGEKEPADARQYRLSELAVAIDEASDGEPERAAALLTTAWFESRLSRRVHEQGPRKDTKGWAISLWSLHSWDLVPHEEWSALGGVAGTRDAAFAADRVLQWARARCYSVSGMYALYATGKRCTWKGARNRVWLHKKLLATLQEAD